jgi:hypothetical protein
MYSIMSRTRKNSWIEFVKKVRRENKGKSFKEVLKLASKLKKEGKMHGGVGNASSSSNFADNAAPVTGGRRTRRRRRSRRSRR